MGGGRKRLVIISGLSGAGKSAAIKCFEDSGFFCVDNLPPPLIPKFMELCSQPGSDVSHIALGIDIRNREFLNQFMDVYAALRHEGWPVELIFMDTRDEILVRRFSESRRPHPLAKNRLVIDGILEEREKLAGLKQRATQIIDTSDLSPSQLKGMILHRHLQSGRGERLQIMLISFGFKLGLPYGLDLLFDVRFLKNPYFQGDLRGLTGNDPPVREFLLALPEADLFVKKTLDFLDFLIPLYQLEGKSYLTIGIGCTGGRHRSVAIVNILQEALQQKVQVGGLSCIHRDVHRTPVE